MGAISYKPAEGKKKEKRKKFYRLYRKKLPWYGKT